MQTEFLVLTCRRRYQVKYKRYDIGRIVTIYKYAYIYAVAELARPTTMLASV